MTAVAAVAAVALMLAGAAVPTPVWAADEKLVVNGGFENGLTGWFVNNGNATDAAVCRPPPTPTPARAPRIVTGRATTGSGPMQDLSGKVQAGQTYALTARHQVREREQPGHASSSSPRCTTAVAPTPTSSAATATKGQWARIEGTFTIPPAQSVSTARGCSSRRRGRATRRPTRPCI